MSWKFGAGDHCELGDAAPSGPGPTHSGSLAHIAILQGRERGGGAVQNSYKEVGLEPHGKPQDGRNGVSAVTTVLGLPSEAFYVLLGAVVGAVASLVATWFKEWLDRRHLRKRVAALLRIEIRAQAAASLAIASLANLLRKENRQ